MSQLKFSLKVWNKTFRLAGPGPPGPNPWLRSCNTIIKHTNHGYFLQDTAYYFYISWSLLAVFAL